MWLVHIKRWSILCKREVQMADGWPPCWQHTGCCALTRIFSMYMIGEKIYRCGEYLMSFSSIGSFTCNMIWWIPHWKNWQQVNRLSVEKVQRLSARNRSMMCYEIVQKPCVSLKPIKSEALREYADQIDSILVRRERLLLLGDSTITERLFAEICGEKSYSWSSPCKRWCANMNRVKQSWSIPCMDWQSFTL